MVSDEGVKNVNSYDIFANIVPGLVFIFGLLAVFRVSPVLDILFGGETSLSFGIPELLVLITAAFVIGQILQVIGGYFDGDHGFDQFMWKIRGRDVKSRYEISDFEDKFWDMCRTRFQLTGDFDSHDRLFKALLTYLDSHGKSRALRIQALYLFTRGLFVATISLMFVYFILFISLTFGLIPDVWTEIFREKWVMMLSAFVLIPVAFFAHHRRKEFENDWVEYMITESYLRMIDE